MDRLEKFLNRLIKSDRKRIEKITYQLEINNLDKLKMKKMKGFKNLFSVRVGKIRIVFMREKSENLVLDIDYRKNIYKKFSN